MRTRDLVILLAVVAGSGWGSVGSCRSEALAASGYRILLELEPRSQPNPGDFARSVFPTHAFSM